MLTPLVKVRAKTVLRRTYPATLLSVGEKAREMGTSGRDMDRQDQAKLEYQQRLAVTTASTENSNGTEDVPQFDNLELTQVPEMTLTTVPSQEVSSSSFAEGITGGAPNQTGNGGDTCKLGDGDILSAIFAQGYADQSVVAITDITYDLSKGETFCEPEEFLEQEAYLKR